MRRLAWLLGVGALAGCDLNLNALGCDYTRDFTDQMSARGLNTLLADAEAGDLRIVGRRGSNEFTVRAHACAKSRSTLEFINFRMDRINGSARVTTYLPTYTDTRLDLVIEVPQDFAVEVYDLEGDIEIDDVYSIWLNDTSGDIDIDGVNQDVYVDEDGSGDIFVQNVGRDFTVAYDRSGRIDYRNVRGRVQLP